MWCSDHSRSRSFEIKATISLQSLVYSLPITPRARFSQTAAEKLHSRNKVVPCFQQFITQRTCRVNRRPHPHFSIMSPVDNILCIAIHVRKANLCVAYVNQTPLLQAQSGPCTLSNSHVDFVENLL